MSADSRGSRRGKAKRGQDPAVDTEMVESADLLDPIENRDSEDRDTKDGPGRRRVGPGMKSEGPPTMMERIESLLRMGSLIAISASVALAAYQFYQGRVDDRKEESVKLMNKWQDSPAQRAYVELSQKLEARLDASRPIQGQVTPRALSHIKYSIGKAVIAEMSENDQTDGSRSPDIDAVFRFFSEIEFCIRANLCDAPLLITYFGEEAASFWEYFRAHAEAKRESFYPDYGRPLESFVEQLERH